MSGVSGHANLNQQDVRSGTITLLSRLEASCDQNVGQHLRAKFKKYVCMAPVKIALEVYPQVFCNTFNLTF